MRPTIHDLPYAIGKVGRFVLKPPQGNFVLKFLFPSRKLLFLGGSYLPHASFDLLSS